MLESRDSGEGDLGWKHEGGLAGAASGEDILGGSGPILNSPPEQTRCGGSGGSEAGGSRTDEAWRVSRQRGRDRVATGPEGAGSCPREAPAAGAGPGQGRGRPQVPSQQDLQWGDSLSLTLVTRTRSVANLGRGGEWSLK